MPLAENETLVDIEREAEKICLWGAARAGVIVVAPLVGTMALMANEVYMIMRLGELRGVKLEESTVLGLLYSLGGSFVGQTLVTLIPLAPVQVPVAIAVTYGVGKVANAWLRAGQPEDIAQFKEIFEAARDEGMARFREIAGLECKDEPLGDEGRKFSLEPEAIFKNIREKADAAADKVEGTISEAMAWLRPLQEKSLRWLSAQKWEELGRGGLTLPYEEIASYLESALKGSGFDFRSIGYHEDGAIALELSGENLDSFTLYILTDEFIVRKDKAYARLRLADFTVDREKLPGKLVHLVGSKLILSVVNRIFDETVLENEALVCTYAGGVLEISFTELMLASKFTKTRIMGKNILDAVEFVALIPTPRGLVIKSRFDL